MSPQIRLMIAIRLSWLCKLGFLGKREEYIYMLRDVRRGGLQLQLQLVSVLA
jgi:hypothetical protein